MYISIKQAKYKWYKRYLVFGLSASRKPYKPKRKGIVEKRKPLRKEQNYVIRKLSSEMV